MAAKRKSDSDWVSWVVIAVLFLVGLSPIALVVLLVKLFGRDGKKRTQAPPLQTDLPRQSAAAQPGRAQQAARKVTQSPAVKKSNAKKLKIVGIVAAVIGILGLNDPIDAFFWSDYWMEFYFLDLLQYLTIAAAGVALFCGGISMDRQLKRFEKYLAVLGEREAMPVEELARTLGYPEKRVERDLGKMIDKGYFGGTAYLNVELGYLFRSGRADEALKKQRQKEQAAAQQPPKETEEGYSGILRGIRRANDAIADPVLSAKIDRLEEITAKIFRAVEEDPRKKDRIGTFLNYYLPTTQKLLDSYAEFEAAGVEGENLRQAKSRIASTMDSIVAGFEHQLDELYKADALDVDSDIRVMETILKRDTASAARDFGLEGESGEAVQQRSE